LKTTWRRLYWREFAQLLKDDAEPAESQPDTRPIIIWRIVSR
jgi:hypothetical protein